MLRIGAQVRASQQAPTNMRGRGHEQHRHPPDMHALVLVGQPAKSRDMDRRCRGALRDSVTEVRRGVSSRDTGISDFVSRIVPRRVLPLTVAMRAY